MFGIDADALNINDQLKLRQYELLVSEIKDLGQAKELLVSLSKQLVIREAYYKSIVKNLVI